VLPRGGSPDESLGAFVRRRLGREALERVAQPLVGGVYTADPDELSLGATMPRFLEMERRERSVILALWRAARRAPALHAGTSGARWSLFVTFAEGMEELIRLLATRLPPGAVRLKERAATVERDGGGWRVTTAAGAVFTADALILSPEAHQAARLLRYVDPALAHLLGGIPYASAATVTLAYRRADIGHPLDGFGFVVPQIERRPVFAGSFSSVKYAGRAPEGHVLLRVFIGGALNESALDAEDGALVQTARAQLGELLGVTGTPLFTRVARYPHAMPQYHVGHMARAEAIERAVAQHAGLRLAGGAYRGVGIADCVRSGEEAAEGVAG
jgi:oxygen-dependent protoporphyrinogen oxidase